MNTNSRDEFYLKELYDTRQRYPKSFCVQNAIAHLEEKLGKTKTVERVDPLHEFFRKLR